MSELVDYTDRVCKNLVAENPIQTLKDREFEMQAKAYRDANLPTHLRRLSYDYRVDKAKRLAFVNHSLDEFVAMLMGEPPTAVRAPGERFNYEYTYDPVTENENANSYWIRQPSFVRGHWWSRKYVVQRRPMGDLLRPVPYGIVLRLQEIKALKIFNAFSVLAPREAFSERTFDKDPIIVGEIWRESFPQLNEYGDSDLDHTPQETYFFIAQWGDEKSAAIV